MKLFIKRALRSFSQNIKSYIAVIIITMLSVMLFTGLSANYHRLDRNIDATLSGSNVADNFITVRKCNEADELHFLSNTNYDNKTLDFDIEKLEKRLFAEAYIKERKIYVAADDGTNTMGLPCDNVMPSDGVVITKSFAKRRNIKPGDSITVSLKACPKDILKISDEMESVFSSSVREGYTNFISEASEINLSFKVNGIMNHGEAMGALASDVGFLYLKMSTLKESILSLINEYYNLSTYHKSLIGMSVNNSHLENQYMIKGGNLNSFKKYYITKNTGDLIVAASKENMPGINTALTDANQAKMLCYVFPLVFYVTAILIIAATIDKHITDDYEAIGVLMSSGVKKRSIIGYYLFLSLIAVFVGSLIGLIIGPYIIPKILDLKYSALYSMKSAKMKYIYPEYLIIFLTIIFVCFIFTLIKALLVMHHNPREIVSNNVRKNKRNIFIDKILPKRAFSLKMALRNIFWNKTKSLLVVIGVLGCTSLLVCGYGIEDTINYGLNLEMNEKLNFDIEASYNHTMLDKNKIKALDDRIEYTEEYSYSLVTVEAEDQMVDTILTVLSPNTKLNVSKNLSGAVISKKLAKTMHVGLGDNIGIYSSGNMYYIEVSAISEMFVSQGIYITSDVAPMPFENNRCIIDCKKGSDLKSVCDSIEGSKVSSETGIYYAKTKAERIKTAKNYIQTLKIITAMIKAFAIMLAVAVIYNLIALNFSERRKNIALERALGYGYKMNVKSLLYETTILSAVGSFIGAMLGMPMLKLVLGINEVPLVGFIYHIYPKSYIISLCLTVALSIVLNMLVSIKIKDINLVSELKTREE